MNAERPTHGLLPAGGTDAKPSTIELVRIAEARRRKPKAKCGWQGLSSAPPFVSADRNAMYYGTNVIPFDKLNGFTFIIREM